MDTIITPEIVDDCPAAGRAWDGADVADLALAKQLLEEECLAGRLAEIIGDPIENLIKMLPPQARAMIDKTTEKALWSALRVASSTLSAGTRGASAKLHKLGAMVAGGTSGAFGVSLLAFELPVTTILMMRAILDIARAHGHDIKSPKVMASAIEVFALGAKSNQRDDGVEVSYYATRLALAQAVREASRHLAAKGLASKGAPALVRLVAAVGSRFGVAVGEKAAAQLVPLVGAVGGAVINTLFMSHFQDLARGHFTILRLEEKYGAEAVRARYEGLGHEA